MPPRGVTSPKRKRQYEHIKESELEKGENTDRAEEIAARTVNKQRRASGETKAQRGASRGGRKRTGEAASGARKSAARKRTGASKGTRKTAAKRTRGAAKRAAGATKRTARKK